VARIGKGLEANLAEVAGLAGGNVAVKMSDDALR